MRILFCNYEYPPLGGGGGVFTAALAQELATRHEVTVLTSQGRGVPSEEVARGVRVVRVPVFLRRRQAVANLPSLAAYVLMGVPAGKRLLRERAFDVINTHFALPTGPVGDALSRWGMVPNVLTLIGGDVYDPSKWTSPHRHPWLRGRVRSLVRRADAVVVSSANVQGYLERYYAPGVPAQRIALAIERPPEVEAAPRAAYGFGPDDVLLVTVGRLVARKAVDQLLAVLQRLGARAGLLVLGSGPEEGALRREAEARGVASRARFLGHIDGPEKFRLLRMCDVYASTSQHEGYGLVFVEAMTCGLPVVCYDHGGQTDFLEDGATGFLVPLNDLAQCEARCRQLAADAALRRRMGEENRRRAETLLIDHCAQRYEAAFEEAIARRRAASGPAPRRLAAPRAFAEAHA